MTMANDAPAGLGLRERKKLKTRAAIREHALRLVRDQGYAATTVEQIAAAADVSQSTFFRYFPTKEDAILYDPYDPLLAEAFLAQPADLSPLPALRQATRSVFADLPPTEMERTRGLLELILAEPDLRVRFMDELGRSLDFLAELVGQRVARSANDPAVRSFAGAVVGAVFSVLLTAAEDPDTDLLAALDAALGHLEAGLPL